MIEIVTNILMK